MGYDTPLRNLSLLDNFLIGSFEPAEFRVLLGQLCGEPLTAELPPMTETPRSFFSRTVRTLDRHGLIDGALFDALGRERPRRQGELQRLAACLAVAPLAEDDRRTVVWRRPDGEGEDQRLSVVEGLERKLVERERTELDTAARSLLDRDIERLARSLRQIDPPGPGTVVAGSRIERFLGAGNFGTVWHAHHLRTGEPVATKIFNLDRLTEGVMLWRFRRSIRALHALARYRDAPDSVPRLLEVASDSLSFTMPYFAGGTLERIDRRGWSLGVKLEHFLATCRAVEFAHKVGIIHRDIKPANVLLDAPSRVVLIDYDIADIRFVTELSVAKGGLGTPVFAAPEQLEGADAADERSDIYSLGRLLHYMLLERSPGYQIERDPDLANLAGYSRALVQIVRRATQWAPARRHASVSELIAALERHHTGRAATQARLRGAARWVRKNTAILAVFSTITGAALAVAAHRENMLARVRELTAEVDALHRGVAAQQKDYAQLEHERDELAQVPSNALSPVQAERLQRLITQILPERRKALTAQTTQIEQTLADLRTASGTPPSAPVARQEQEVASAVAPGLLPVTPAATPARRSVALTAPPDLPVAPTATSDPLPVAPTVGTPALLAVASASPLPFAVPDADPSMAVAVDLTTPKARRSARRSHQDLPEVLAFGAFTATLEDGPAARIRDCLKAYKYEVQTAFKLKFTILPSGAVGEVQIPRAIRGDTAKCIQDEAMAVTFPPALNEVNHAYPIK